MKLGEMHSKSFSKWLPGFQTHRSSKVTINIWVLIQTLSMGLLQWGLTRKGITHILNQIKKIILSFWLKLNFCLSDRNINFAIIERNSINFLFRWNPCVEVVRLKIKLNLIVMHNKWIFVDGLLLVSQLWIQIF